MKNLRRAGVVAGLAVLACAAPGFAANVTVRVEGQSQTLVPETALQTPAGAVSKDGEHSCPGASAVGALDAATAGDWSGPWTFSQEIHTIEGETHTFDPNADANRYWSFWVNYRYQNQGACDVQLQDGDDVLFFVDCFGDCQQQTPLRLEVPATARPGEAVQARVTEHEVSYDQNFVGSTTAKPSAGATVTVDGRQYVTDDRGIANIVLGERGPHGVQATKPDKVRSANESVCVTDGSDGFCGTVVPPVPCATDGADGLCGTRDRRAPQAMITGISEKQRFTRGDAPRELTGSVGADPSGLHMVKLRLTRRWHGRCWYFSGRMETWRRTRCGRSFPFAIGDRADWSYLLPERVRRGRFVLDVIAIDRAFNRDTLARGRNRVVFQVR